MILTSKAELAGRVKLRIHGGARGEIKYPWQCNMLLDQGITRLLTGPTALNYSIHQFIGLGSSSQPVEPTDTGLVAPLVRLSRNSLYRGQENGWDEPGGFGWTREVYSFPRGAAAGNISEMATFHSNNNLSATCRALVRDSEGLPTTISVLADEVLEVTWEWRRWWTPASNEITFEIDGVQHTTLAESKSIAEMPKSGSGLGSGGMLVNFNGAQTSANTAQRVVTWNEDQGNPQISNATPPVVINTGVVFPYMTNLITFKPPIPKTNEFVARVTWSLTLSRRLE